MIKSLLHVGLVAILLFGSGVPPSHAQGRIHIEAPPALDPFKVQLESVDLSRVGAALVDAGLALPPSMRVTLIPELDPRARRLPSWIVGLAYGDAEIVLFPQRVRPYPYDSLESVLRHEITHLALTRQAAGGPLPRWFHEGVAMAVDDDWGIGGQLRLLFEMAREPGTDRLDELFAAGTAPDSALAYAMSAALVAHLQRRHGADAPGRIAARVASGETFFTAFVRQTGETPDEAASRAWRLYRRWTNWVPAATSGSAIWFGIMAVAAAAWVAVRRRRARRRAEWDREDAEWTERVETEPAERADTELTSRMRARRDTAE